MKPALPISSLHYSQSKKLTSTELNVLFAEVGWSSRFDWSKYLENSDMVITCRDKYKTVGLGRLMIVNDECMIFDLCVSPDYQRRGIGTRILKGLENRAIKLGYSLMKTESSSKEAQMLFLKLGYKESGRKSINNIVYIQFQKVINPKLYKEFI